jgi:hypothetical protein
VDAAGFACPAATINLTAMLDGGILIARLPKGQIGEDTSRLIGQEQQQPERHGDKNKRELPGFVAGQEGLVGKASAGDRSAGRSANPRANAPRLRTTSIPASRAHAA